MVTAAAAPDLVDYYRTFGIPLIEVPELAAA